MMMNLNLRQLYMETGRAPRLLVSQIKGWMHRVHPAAVCLQATNVDNRRPKVPTDTTK